ncbi:MAG: 30S ribosomal protein S20 [Candidatus Roizmanbacteria bacterium]
MFLFVISITLYYNTTFGKRSVNHFSIERRCNSVPIIKSAKKKLKQDKVRTTQNTAYKRSYKSAMKAMTGVKKATGEALKKAYSAIDKAAKLRVIHKNKAKRLKSQAAKKVVAKKKK